MISTEEDWSGRDGQDGDAGEKSVHARPAQTQRLYTNTNVPQTFRVVVQNHPYRGGNLEVNLQRLFFLRVPSCQSLCKLQACSLVAAASSLTATPLWASLAVHVYICLLLYPWPCLHFLLVLLLCRILLY